MSIVSSGRSRSAGRLLRCAVAVGCLLALSACVVYPAGPGYYGHPAYYGYYGHPYYWR